MYSYTVQEHTQPWGLSFVAQGLVALEANMEMPQGMETAGPLATANFSLVLNSRRNLTEVFFAMNNMQ